jgi:hypothetical protein
MDEDAFRNTLQALNRDDCLFEKAIVICRHACRHARMIGIGERSVVGCSAPAAREKCQELLALLHSNATFALHLSDTSRLAHGKEIRVQCGGLQGLQQALAAEDEEIHAIPDISALVDEAETNFNGLENLPFSRIVRAIVHYEARKRRRTPS